jgi:hypothetical protein
MRPKAPDASTPKTSPAKIHQARRPRIPSISTMSNNRLMLDPRVRILPSEAPASPLTNKQIWGSQYTDFEPAYQALGCGKPALWTLPRAQGVEPSFPAAARGYIGGGRRAVNIEMRSRRKILRRRAEPNSQRIPSARNSAWRTGGSSSPPPFPRTRSAGASAAAR